MDAGDGVVMKSTGRDTVLVRDGNGALSVPVLEPDVDLNEWMKEHHAQLRDETIGKAHEYGSLDLQIMGASLAKVMNGIGEGAPPVSQLQAAIAIYLMGKVARVLSALAEGKPAPTDSWKDAEVYSMMGLYVQEHGQWP